jgi:hypothetical protein
LPSRVPSRVLSRVVAEKDAGAGADEDGVVRRDRRRATRKRRKHSSPSTTRDARSTETGLEPTFVTRGIVRLITRHHGEQSDALRAEERLVVSETREFEFDVAKFLLALSKPTHAIRPRGILRRRRDELERGDERRSTVGIDR